MSKTIRLLLFAAVLFHISPVQAAVTPVSISVLPPVQFPPSDFNVAGVRASVFYGRQRAMYGIDLGLIGNITELDFTGIGVSGLFNYTKGTTNVLGLQLAGLTNVNTQKTTVFGVQAALGLNYNTAESSVTGLQLALANVSAHTKIYGFQVGIYNRAETVYGFQIGLVNDANNLHGLQIGLLNYNRTGTLAVSPILNAGF